MSIQKQLLSRLFFAGVLLLALSSGIAQAGPVGITCPGDVKCNGNTYELYINEFTPGSYDLFVVMGTAGYLYGDASNLGYLQAISIKVNGVSVADSDGTFLWDFSSSNPGYLGPNDWSNVAGGLSTSADGGCNGNGAGYNCWQWNGGNTGFAFTVGDQLVWGFNLTSPTAPTGIHLKYKFEDANGGKAGDLGSFDMVAGDYCLFNPLDPACDDPAPPPAPEPATLGLLGASLVGLALWKRKRV